ncbi:MAG: VOC family protein [Elusimicrobia bacterium]|nr:VOC family protein [Elusimicrobiota bacterium]
MTALPAPTLGIRHVALKVGNLKKMEGFYAEVLGYRVEWRPDPENVYLSLGPDNLALHQAPVEGAGALDHFGIFLKAPEDVDAWAAHLIGQGYALLKEPKTHRDGTRSFYVNDPEGNTIQFLHHPALRS